MKMDMAVYVIDGNLVENWRAWKSVMHLHDPAIGGIKVYVD